MSVIIRLQLLPLSAAATDVRAFFHGLRIPDGSVHIVGGPEGDAFIGFASDEDARQAMRRDHGRIHGEEIRLLLSSRAEMNDVISKAKAGIRQLVDPDPISVKADVKQDSSWENQVSDVRTPSTFAPDMSDYSKPAYMRLPESDQQYGGGSPHGGYQANFASRDEGPRGYGHSQSTHTYNGPDLHSNQPQYAQEPSLAQFHGNSEPQDNKAALEALAKLPSHLRPPFGLPPPHLRHLFPGMSGKPPAIPHPPHAGASSVGLPPQGPPPVVLRNEHVDRDTRGESDTFRNGKSNLPARYGMPPPSTAGPPPVGNYSPMPSTVSHQGPSATSPTGDHSARNESWRDSVSQQQPPSTEKVWNGAHQSISQHYNGPSGAHTGRKTLLNQSVGNVKAESNRPPSPYGGHHENPPQMSVNISTPRTHMPPPRPQMNINNGPPMNLPPPSHLRNGPAHPGRPPMHPSTGMPSGPPMGGSRGMPPVGHPPIQGPPSMPPRLQQSQAQSLRYFELSRLPTEMLRPSVLENFVRPTIPLTLSSVKVVYSAQGIHLHTLIRLECEEDATTLLNKDGEQGIRVRPTTKNIFDEAVDGPLAPAAGNAQVMSSPAPNSEEHPTDQRVSPPRMGGDRMDDRDGERGDRERGNRRRRRSRSRSPMRGHGRRGGRGRGFRSRSRERRGRDHRRSRSRSPVRRGRQEPNRWCLQMTNVPFRITEEDIVLWFSERVKPSKVVRTFYADGNASDRWVAEFESESMLERARGMRNTLQGRTIKTSYIDNDYADEIIAIEDKYGESKRCENELKQMAELQMQHLNGTLPPPLPMHPGPMHPPMRGRGAMMGGGPMRGMPPRHNGPLPPFMPPGHGHGPGPNGMGPPPHGMPPMMPPGGYPPPFMRGRGRGRGAPMYGGPMRGGSHGYFPSPPSFNSHREPPFDMHHVGERQNGQAHNENENNSGNGNEKEEPMSVSLDADLIASIGEPGCVVACQGFPSDITMQDVISFFDGFSVDENSVRMRMGDDGLGTGECMLALGDPQTARSAVAALNGKSLRGKRVSMCVATT